MDATLQAQMLANDVEYALHQAITDLRDISDRLKDYLQTNGAGPGGTFEAACYFEWINHDIGEMEKWLLVAVRDAQLPPASPIDPERMVDIDQALLNATLEIGAHIKDDTPIDFDLTYGSE